MTHRNDRYGVKHVKGGWQGGRGWQVNATALNEPNGVYLLAGKWMIENVWEALDYPNEWFFDQAESKLYMIPNATVPDGDARTYNAPPPSDVVRNRIYFESRALMGCTNLPS